MENKRIIILGAAGFIGKNLTARLLQEGYPLTLFDRPGGSYPAAVGQAAARGQVCLAEGNFGDPVPGLFDGLGEVDCVYHLISTTCPSNSNRDVAREMEENLVATIRFLDACVENRVKKVVFLSSGGTVYGKLHTGICREEEEAFPITSYGVQKLAIEKVLYLYHEMYGLEYRIVRLSNPYGPYQRPDGVQGVVSTFTYRALQGLPIAVYGDGSVVRDYIYIADAVEGILKIADGGKGHCLYNLGSGRGATVLDVIDGITRVLGKKPEVTFLPGRPVDVPVNVLDVTRFEKDFGTAAKVSLEEGIEKLVRFYQGEENV